MCSCRLELDSGAVISVDPASGLPPYEQIKAQITAARASGEARAGDRLPPVRSLARSLGLAPNTVARAYRELEANGQIETRGRLGSFIAGRNDQLDAGAEAARRYVAEAESLGIVPEVALRLVRAALADRL